MAAYITHVSNFYRQVIAGLPLNVECVIDRVGQFVLPVIDAEGEGLSALDNLG